MYEFDRGYFDISFEISRKEVGTRWRPSAIKIILSIHGFGELPQPVTEFILHYNKEMRENVDLAFVQEYEDHEDFDILSDLLWDELRWISAEE